ncbi:DMT family transporter [Variovorax sp. OV329]|uniref:DMT family transporter n=1 Tax=Variovorax sp. OV329 TaxID=1882825 RepID=UPI0008EE3A73|nr:DMT family transporter [Variovorax sp. OV329]SFM05532.1 drug/metabolite transporter, DME family [Variovorax sp. OV329]
MQIRPGLGVAMVLAAAALWGTTGTSQSLAEGQLSAGWFGALRLAVASAFFGLYAWSTRRGPSGLAHAGAPLPWPGVLGAGLCMAVYNLAFFAGVRLTGVGLGTAIALGSGPLWAGMLQALVSRQLPSLRWWIGTVAAVGGGALMTLSSGSAGHALSTAGIGLCLVAGLSYAVYTLINKSLVREVGAARATLSAFTVAAVVALPAAWIEGGTPTPVAADLWAALYVGVVTAGVAYLLFSHALRHISAATGVTLALFEPVVAFTLATLVLGERPGAMAFAGLVLVVAGVLVVVRAELRDARAIAGSGEPGVQAG